MAFPIDQHNLQQIQAFGLKKFVNIAVIDMPSSICPDATNAHQMQRTKFHPSSSC